MALKKSSALSAFGSLSLSLLSDTLKEKTDVEDLKFMSLKK